MTGTATYSGHVAANITNGGTYIAFGNYTQNWDFSSRTGTATISNLDGGTYTGSMAAVTNSGGAEYHGSISGTNGRNGTLQGSFMKGASNDAGDVAMQFHVVGSGYAAVGVGLAKKP